MIHAVFYKHSLYMHRQPEIWPKIKHHPSTSPSLTLLTHTNFVCRISAIFDYEMLANFLKFSSYLLSKGKNSFSIINKVTSPSERDLLDITLAWYGQSMACKDTSFLSLWFKRSTG